MEKKKYAVILLFAAFAGLFFALDLFGLDRGIETLVDFGCGYGTFTLPAAKMISGTLHALDIAVDAALLFKFCTMTGPFGSSAKRGASSDPAVAWPSSTGITTKPRRGARPVIRPRPEQ